MPRMQGIVLAGGKSSRFGDDKALALAGGVPMIQRAVQLLDDLCLDPCVITSSLRDYSFLKCRIENDLIPDKGPLGGLYTAFSIFENMPLIVLTCDMPLVSSEMLCVLKQAHTSANGAALYQRANKDPEPFPVVYGPGLKSLAKDCLDSGRLSVREFIQRIQWKKFVPLPPGRDFFANINFKRDLQEISRSTRSKHLVKKANGN